jgi:hypothetical protein
MQAVAALIAGHMAAQHMLLWAALLAFDQYLLSEQRMPRICDSTQLRALGFVCGDSNITLADMTRQDAFRASTGWPSSP